MVIQTPCQDRDAVRRCVEKHGLGPSLHHIGAPRWVNETITIRHGAQEVLASDRATLHAIWSQTTRQMQALRDNPECAEEEYKGKLSQNPGLRATRLTFDPAHRSGPLVGGRRPRVAILREQGVNSHYEMAAAFDRAGFEVMDVPMSLLATGEIELASFQGVAACGGFSYGDVLGAGQGWAKSILYNARLRDQVAGFFQCEDHFALGSCNGCQLFSSLAELIPGATHWPRFVRNRSEQYEARLVLVEVMDSVSPFFDGMQGSLIPVVVAHGEGKAQFRNEGDLEQLHEARQVTMRYATAPGVAAHAYPANPSGSPLGLTGITNLDGRVVLMMPHPERAFRSVQCSWAPPEWGEEGAWLRLFDNIRKWVG